MLDLSNIQEIIKESKIGVTGFINPSTKEAYIWPTSETTLSLIDAIKNIERNQHRIKSLDGWKLYYSNAEEQSDNGQLIHKYKVGLLLAHNGYTIISDFPKYKLKGVLRPDFRPDYPHHTLYYVFLETSNKTKVKLIAIFDKVYEGKAFVKNPPYNLEVGQKQKDLLHAYNNPTFTKENLFL